MSLLSVEGRIGNLCGPFFVSVPWLLPAQPPPLVALSAVVPVEPAQTVHKELWQALPRQAPAPAR